MNHSPLNNEGVNAGHETTTQPALNPTGSQRRKAGVIMVAVGAFLCVFGFLITMMLIQHEVNFNFALYGTTGLGGSLLLGGMVAILG